MGLGDGRTLQVSAALRPESSVTFKVQMKRPRDQSGTGVGGCVGVLCRKGVQRSAATHLFITYLVLLKIPHIYSFPAIYPYHRFKRVNIKIDKSFYGGPPVVSVQ